MSRTYGFGIFAKIAGIDRGTTAKMRKLCLSRVRIRKRKLQPESVLKTQQLSNDILTYAIKSFGLTLCIAFATGEVVPEDSTGVTTCVFGDRTDCIASGNMTAF